MANKDKRILNVILKPEPVAARPQTAAQRPKPMRTQEELTLLALRVMENTTLMQRFRAVISSEDKDQARDVIAEVTKYAQKLDSSVSVPEGTQIVIALMKMVGHPRGHASP